MKGLDVCEFARMERDLHLFDRQYNGFPYWQYLRNSVCEALEAGDRQAELKIAEQAGKQRPQKALRCLPYVFRDIWLLLSGKRYDLIIFLDGAVHHRLLDCWNLPGTVRALTIRTDIALNHMRPHEHHYGIPRIMCSLRRRIKKLFRRDRIDPEERAFLRELEKRLVARYGYSLSAEEMERSILAHVDTRYCYQKYFQALFSRTRCKALLTICYYQSPLYPAYGTAKERGIPVIELQHGVVTNHESYWFEDQRGVNNDTPDYLLTYGDVHNEWVKLAGGARAVSVGYPYQEFMVKNLENLIPREDSVIVYPERFAPYEQLIVDFITRYTQYTVLVKLHPLHAGHEREYFPILSGNPNVRFISSQEKGIYYWLKYARHHVLGSTTVGLEAMAFDHCNVCIMESLPHAQTQCLLDWGVARSFAAADELAALIASPLPDTPELRKARNRLWKRNARENIEAVLRGFSDNGWHYAD